MNLGELQELIYGIGFGLGTLVLGTVVLVVMIRQVGNLMVARTNIAREEEYQRLATQSLEAQRRSVDAQELLTRQVTELTTRLTSVERLLKQVE
jgi:hypothetical protein